MAAQLLTVKTLNIVSRLGRLGIRQSNVICSAVYKRQNFTLVRNNPVNRPIPKFTNYLSITQTYSTGVSSGKIYIEFTCKKCDTRNKKFMSKVAYNSGVVIITCDGCKNNHLIADNLNWFTDLNGKKNIEDILREKGESVRKISVSEEGVSEIIKEIKSIE